MKKENKSRDEYIAELKKKYGELVEPNEFDDEIYIKVEEAMEDVRNGRVYTLEEVDEEMKREFPFLRDDFGKNNDKFIAEEGEKYNGN